MVVCPASRGVTMQRLTKHTIAFTVGMGLAAAGCGDNLGDDAGPDAAAPATRTAYAVSGDFGTTGVFSTIDVLGRTVRPNALAGVAGGDPFLRAIGDELLIVNRDSGENVTVLGGAPLALIDQYATGGGSNPQDVAVVGGKLYVPVLGGSGVVVIDRATHASHAVAIPGDPDGKPDCVSAAAVGAEVYVACGLLDDTFTPRGDGLIAVIDTATDTVTATVAMPAANPVGVLAPTSDGALLIGTAPSFTDFATGCVVRVAPGAPRPTATCAVTNAQLGGLANHIDVGPDGDVVIAVTGFAPDFSSQFGRLRMVDHTTFAPGAVMSKDGQQIDDVAACGDGYVVAADGTMGASGVRIFKDGQETTTAPLDIGRPTGFGNNLACR